LSSRAKHVRAWINVYCPLRKRSLLLTTNEEKNDRSHGSRVTHRYRLLWVGLTRCIRRRIGRERDRSDVARELTRRRRGDHRDPDGRRTWRPRWVDFGPVKGSLHRRRLHLRRPGARNIAMHSSYHPETTGAKSQIGTSRRSLPRAGWPDTLACQLTDVHIAVSWRYLRACFVAGMSSLTRAAWAPDGHWREKPSEVDGAAPHGDARRLLGRHATPRAASASRSSSNADGLHSSRWRLGCHPSIPIGGPSRWVDWSPMYRPTAICSRVPSPTWTRSSQGRRSGGRAADEVRAGNQPQGRQGARPDERALGAGRASLRKSRAGPRGWPLRRRSWGGVSPARLDSTGELRTASVATLPWGGDGPARGLHSRDVTCQAPTPTVSGAAASPVRLAKHLDMIVGAPSAMIGQTPTGDKTW